MSCKVWNIKNPQLEHGAEIDEMANALGVHRVTAELLWNRGLCDTAAALRFLRREEELFYDSFLMLGMREAVDRIIPAVESRERIVIYGDYDVDGVTAVSTLYLYLKEHGADVGYYIPNRVGEGYGVSRGAVDSLAAGGASLMITVDTGITANDEVEYAATLGMDVVVTDHHECHGELPKAVAVVNPRRPDCGYPFKELAGVGVVFKLICALEQTFNARSGEERNFIRDICMKYSDLVAIGTVADVMPLVDENRLIVSLGMQLIERTERLGLSALLELSGTSETKPGRQPKKRRVTSSLIGYVIAPRINAAGRINSAERAVELFLTDSPAVARQIAGELCETNRKRQNEENAIVEEAYRKIEAEHDFGRDLVIVLDAVGWHHGVIGIVSSRITEHYNLPSILISFDSEAETSVGKGSGRSIKGMNLVNALKECGDYLVKFGGHELAAGLSIERSKLAEFKRRINDYARSVLEPEHLFTSVTVDCELDTRDINLTVAAELYKLEPYGVANPVPVFALRDAVLTDIVPIGGNRHTRMILTKDNVSMTAVYFGHSPESTGFVQGDVIDVVFNLDINEFQNQRSAQLIVRDARYCRSYLKCLEEQRTIYESADSDPASVPDMSVPVRDDFVNVYLYLRHETAKGREKFNFCALDRKLCGIGGPDASSGYAKLRFVLDIMDETGLMTCEKDASDSESCLLRLNNVKSKICLDKSDIYKRLKNRRGSDAGGA